MYGAYAHDVMAAILIFQSNESAAVLLYQTYAVGFQFFSYVNTFFCHVGVPNQSCGSSTLLCKHFLLPYCYTKPILWEFNSFLMETLCSNKFAWLLDTWVHTLYFCKYYCLFVFVFFVFLIFDLWFSPKPDLKSPVKSPVRTLSESLPR